MDSYFIIGKVTTLNTAGTVVLLVGLLAALLLPRRLTAVAFLFVACFMTMGQQLVLGSFSFSIMRLMLAAVLVRAVLRNEGGLRSLTTLDKAVLVWVVIGTVFYVLRLHTAHALVNRLGGAYDAIGLLFLFRFSIRGYEDVRLAIKAMGVAMALLMILMLVEKLTGRNPFAIFGGVPEHAVIREGRLRVQGPFRHPVLAGTFAATSLPMFAALWYSQDVGDRLVSVTAVVSSVVVVVLTASSSPIVASALAVLSFCLWGLRKKMRALWYLLFVGLVALDAVMKAPVWFLIARVEGVLGGSGYHRSMLIDQAIRHLGEWYLAGTSYTAHWMPYALAINPNMADITNQFILEGVEGGLFTLTAFVCIVVVAFRTLGTALRTDASLPREARIIWGMWGSLVCHMATFFSVAYFDQMRVFWYLLLACISLIGTFNNRLEKPFRNTVVRRFSVLAP